MYCLFLFFITLNPAQCGVFFIREQMMAAGSLRFGVPRGRIGQIQVEARRVMREHNRLDGGGMRVPAGTTSASDAFLR
ncbi:hypothetical protein O23A_p2042 [Aeromonas salmonicida]|nr:hypothetical protein O23A_p2042 [Aeromonas salmonicida]